ncbi:MAG: hypothetical protein ACOC3I_07780 [Verrucomicrobiota bacterium]
MAVASPPLIALLGSAVLALLVSPVVLVLFVPSVLGYVGGLGLLGYGAVALWVGMKRLEAAPAADDPPKHP